MLRETVAISVSPTVGGSACGANGPTQKPSNWKTRICNKWETTGSCPFGSKCHFAHGLAGIIHPLPRLLFNCTYCLICIRCIHCGDKTCYELRKLLCLLLLNLILSAIMNSFMLIFSRQKVGNALHVSKSG